MTVIRGALERIYPKPVKPRKLAHVVIRTARYRESLNWWATVLDASPSFENDQLSFMTYDDEHHRIGIINMPNLTEQSPTTAGVEHVCFHLRGAWGVTWRHTSDSRVRGSFHSGPLITARRSRCTTATLIVIKWSCNTTSSRQRKI